MAKQVQVKWDSVQPRLFPAVGTTGGARTLKEHRGEAAGE